MVLTHFGIKTIQTDIAKEMETDQSTGTSVKEIQSFLSNRGLAVAFKNDASWEDIREALPHGLVIVGYIERGGDPHYALVTDITEDSIVLNDPWHGEGFTLKKEEFLERWRDNEAGGYGDQMLMTVHKVNQRE